MIRVSHSCTTSSFHWSFVFPGWLGHHFKSLVEEDVKQLDPMEFIDISTNLLSFQAGWPSFQKFGAIISMVDHIVAIIIILVNIIIIIFFCHLYFINILYFHILSFQAGWPSFQKFGALLQFMVPGLPGAPGAPGALEAPGTPGAPGAPGAPFAPWSSNWCWQVKGQGAIDQILLIYFNFHFRR